MKKFLRILGEIVLVSVVFVVIGYSLNGCDVHPQGLLESDMGKERLDIFTNGVFKHVCIGKHEVVTVGVTNVTNFKCNDGMFHKTMENNTSKEFKHISRPKFKLLNRSEQIEYLKEFIIRFAKVNCQFNEVDISCGSEGVGFNDEHTEFTYYRNYKRICRYKGEDAKALDNALNVAVKKEEEWYNEWLNLISARIKL